MLLLKTRHYLCVPFCIRRALAQIYLDTGNPHRVLVSPKLTDTPLLTTVKLWIKSYVEPQVRAVAGQTLTSFRGRERDSVQ